MLYEPINITHVRSAVRESYKLCESLVIYEHSFEEMKQVINKMLAILEDIDHSDWHMETF